jgi:hypothetical protein
VVDPPFALVGSSGRREPPGVALAIVARNDATGCSPPSGRRTRTSMRTSPVRGLGTSTSTRIDEAVRVAWKGAT